VFAAQGGFAGSTGMFGVIEAHLAHTPMVVLTELSDSDAFNVHGPIQSGTGAYGSFDLPSIFRGSTKYMAVAQAPREAVMSVQLALKHATTGTPGPTAVLMRTSAVKGVIDERAFPRILETQNYLTSGETCPPAPALDAAADLLKAAKRPLIVAGNGARSARAFEGLRELAETLGAPVVTSILGKSAIAETHPLAGGIIGYTGTPLANDSVGMADVILVVGCRLKPQETCFGHPKMFDAKRQKIIQIDIDARNASWTTPAAVALVGDARLTLGLLLERLRGALDAATVSERARSFATLRAAKGLFAHPSLTAQASPIYPQRVVREVQEAAPEAAIICSDAGNNRHWMNHYFQTKRPHSYFGSGGLGGVSWAMAATLAAKIVQPERPAIGVCSDGGFAMQMHALLTAVQYGAAPVYVVMNNSSLGMTAQYMGNRSVGSHFPDTDYAAIARACGCFAERVRNPGEVGEAISAALKQAKPAVIDVVIDQAQDMRKEIYSPYASEVLSGAAAKIY
ncbi:MAG: thiamine pyrophosphate-binding protein, partial [Variibacter sp.]|nr:thiamine pyrophosphate-binding protein [Variibacter sp.]